MDFETKGIDGNTMSNPPEPVGLAVMDEGCEPEYWDVNDPYYQGLMKEIWLGDEDMLWQNGWGFDLCVAKKWLGLPFPDWHRVHDTQFLLYLADPHSPSLGLKPSAIHYLDWEVEAQDELHDWVMANVPEATEKGWGAFIWRAPWEIVAKYAKDDVRMTRALFDELHPLHGGIYAESL